jgi:hypothetical protein
LGRDELMLGAVEKPELPVLPEVLELPVLPELPVLLLDEPWFDDELPEPVDVEEPELLEPEVLADPLAAPGCSCATRMPKATVAPAAVNTVALVTTLRRVRTWSLLAVVWLCRDISLATSSLRPCHPITRASRPSQGRLWVSCASHPGAASKRMDGLCALCRGPLTKK